MTSWFEGRWYVVTRLGSVGGGIPCEQSLIPAQSQLQVEEKDRGGRDFVGSDYDSRVGSCCHERMAVKVLA